MPVGFFGPGGDLAPPRPQREGQRKAMAEISADGDGYVRRRCADCDRHFASSIEQRDTYWCPYCGVQRSWGCWFTPVQQRYLDDALAEDVLVTAYEEVEHVLTELALDSEGVLVDSSQRDQSPTRPPLLEPTADLAPVAVSCHPGAKLKLEPGWSNAACCHLCGTKAQGTRTTLGRVRLRRREF
jgi:hypothetical protein